MFVAEVLLITIVCNSCLSVSVSFPPPLILGDTVVPFLIHFSVVLFPLLDKDTAVVAVFV